MRIDVRCPNCGHTSKIPEVAAGTRVRCGKCKTVFPIAEEAALDVLEELPEDLPEAIQEEPTSPEPRKPKRRVLEPEPDEEDEERPRRRRRKRRSSVWDRVNTPGLALMIVGYGGAALNLLLVIADIAMAFVGDRPGDAGSSGYMVGSICGATVVRILVTVGWSGTIINSAICMRALRSRSTAIGGCIVAMLPCSCGCFAGIPIGIWCLTVLMDEEVKNAFR